MTPPPSLLGGHRHRDRLSFDSALDDTALARARDSLAQGRWTEARTLLAGTGTDWDRRGHRLVVLGQVPSGAVWAKEWKLAEPDSLDAAALLACATAFRALRGKASPDAARKACRAVARMTPADPTPWLALLMLAHATGTDDERLQAFDQVRGRHHYHHHAHHLMTACLAECRPDAGDDPFHEVYDFAYWAAEQAPVDSPLAVLPVVAHTERYRVLARAGMQPSDPAGSAYWTTRHARQAMKAAFDRWLEWEGEGHPRNKVDLNFLAHAKVHEGRMAEATVLFHRIGPYACNAPWSYPDRDPEEAFRAARDAALGAY